MSLGENDGQLLEPAECGRAGASGQIATENQGLADAFAIEIILFLGDMSVFGGCNLPETDSHFALKTPMVASDHPFPFWDPIYFHGPKLLISGSVWLKENQQKIE